MRIFQLLSFLSVTVLFSFCRLNSLTFEQAGHIMSLVQRVFERCILNSQSSSLEECIENFKKEVRNKIAGYFNLTFDYGVDFSTTENRD